MEWPARYPPFSFFWLLDASREKWGLCTYLLTGSTFSSSGERERAAKTCCRSPAFEAVAGLDQEKNSLRQQGEGESREFGVRKVLKGTICRQACRKGGDMWVGSGLCAHFPGPGGVRWGCSAPDTCEDAAELITPWVAAGDRVLAYADGYRAEPSLCLSKGLLVPGLGMDELVCEEVRQELPVLTAPPVAVPFHLSLLALPTVPAPHSASSPVSASWAGGKAA